MASIAGPSVKLERVARRGSATQRRVCPVQTCPEVGDRQQNIFRSLPVLQYGTCSPIALVSLCTYCTRRTPPQTEGVSRFRKVNVACLSVAAKDG